MKLYIRLSVGSDPCQKAPTFLVLDKPPKWLAYYRSYYWSEGSRGYVLGEDFVRTLVPASEFPTTHNQYLEWDTEAQTGYLYTYQES